MQNLKYHLLRFLCEKISVTEIVQKILLWPKHILGYFQWNCFVYISDLAISANVLCKQFHLFDESENKCLDVVLWCVGLVIRAHSTRSTVLRTKATN